MSSKSSNKTATRKQFEYAREISRALGVSLPNEFTVEEYSNFIKFYEKRYKDYLFESNKYGYGELEEEDREIEYGLPSSRFYD